MVSERNEAFDKLFLGLPGIQSDRIFLGGNEAGQASLTGGSTWTDNCP